MASANLQLRSLHLMEKRQESEEPFCGFCNKRFTSSRILQNHMKTHFTSGASDGGDSLNQRDLSCYYGLRENPKKTQRSFSPEASVDRSSARKNLIRCKECGKGFRYEKCLSNHHAGMHSKASEEPRAGLCGFSLVRRKRSRVIRSKKTRLSSFSSFPESLSVSASQEELEVGECLILLSKSSRSFWDGLKLVGQVLEADSGIQDSLRSLSNKKPRTGGEFDQQKQLEGVSVDETSKESSSCLGDKKASKGGVLDQWSVDNHQRKLAEVELKRTCLNDLESKPGSTSRKLGSSEASSEDSTSGITSSSPFVCSETLSESQRNAEHRCRTCDKIFPSYQALGGHQTMHRMRNRALCGLKTEKPVNGSAEHKCSICSRVFRSVHALGGHKKCHHLRKSLSAGDAQIAIEEAYFGSNNEIDLNLPLTAAIDQD